MKKVLLFVAIVLMGFSLAAQNFQAEKGFSFQGYARDFDGAALGNQEITVRFSLFPEGQAVVYQEEQQVDTDAFGLFSAEIGSVSTNDFAAIDFSKGNYFLRVETRANGSDYAIVSETELLAVPYAKSAVNSGNGNPAGTILPYGGVITPSQIPAGYLPCDGREVSQSDYPELYAAIGDAWGTGTAGNFRLPDLRGQFLRGVDAGAGVDPNTSATDRTAKYTGGNTGDNVGSYQNDEFESHDHGGNTSTDGAHSHYDGGHDEFGTGSSIFGGTRNTGSDGGGRRFQTSTAGNHSHTINADGGAETRAKNAYVWFIIKY